MSATTTESVAAPAKVLYRRRKKFIRRDLQLKIIFGAIFVSVTVLIFNYQIPIIGFWIMERVSPDGPWRFYAPVQRLLLSSLGISLLLTVPLAIWMGVVFSFHFCGPIYRIKKYFQDLLSGTWEQRCRLRRTDDLHDIKDVINQFVGQVEGRLRAQNQTLLEARAVLESRLGAAAAQDDQVRGLLERLAREAAEFDRHFPVQAVGAAGAAAGAAPEKEAAREAVSV